MDIREAADKANVSGMMMRRTSWPKRLRVKPTNEPLKGCMIFDGVRPPAKMFAFKLDDLIAGDWEITSC